VLDRVQSAQVTLSSINVGQRQWRLAGFVNDDYKMRPNLTFNIGLRYEFDEPWFEHDNKTGNVDIATGQVIYAGEIPSALRQARASAPTRLLPAEFPADHAAPRICVSIH